MTATPILKHDGIFVIPECERKYISRNEAKERGLMFFFDGRECKFGHVYFRYVRNWYCVACKRIETASRDKIKQAADARKYYELNKDRVAKAHSIYEKANAQKQRDKANKRRHLLLRATPKLADLGKIREIYKEAKSRGLTVDHIIPLNNPLVSGLHVAWNLQIISKSANSKKGNSIT